MLTATAIYVTLGPNVLAGPFDHIAEAFVWMRDNATKATVSRLPRMEKV